MGGFEAFLSGNAEPSMKHHLSFAMILTLTHYLGGGQCQRVSLTGAVSSKSVTEERYGSLSMVVNHASSVLAEGSLTVRHTCRTDTKVGQSDPVV